MVVSFCLLNLSYQDALLSSSLEQFWESRLIFISLSMFELWIIIVDLGLFTTVVSVCCMPEVPALHSAADCSLQCCISLP